MDVLRVERLCQRKAKKALEVCVYLYSYLASYLNLMYIICAENSAVLRTMTFWKNGFSVGDGELMRYDNPANNKLLEQINAG